MSAPSSPLTATSFKRMAARVFCLCVLGAQAYAVVHAYHDPLKRFGYQPFAESSVYRAEIAAVDGAGRRVSIAKGFSGYRWQTLVRARVANPFHVQSARQGVAATVYFLRRALDYVADHTPRDRTTRYFEARVWYRKNRAPARWLSLRSHERQVP